jgi:hypothetical protein
MHVIDRCWLEVHRHSTLDVLVGRGLQEGVERIAIDADPLVRPHLLVWPDAMLEALQLLAAVPKLDPRLADMDRHHLPHS